MGTYFVIFDAIWIKVKKVTKKMWTLSTFRLGALGIFVQQKKIIFASWKTLFRSILTKWKWTNRFIIERRMRIHVCSLLLKWKFWRTNVGWKAVLGYTQRQQLNCMSPNKRNFCNLFSVLWQIGKKQHSKRNCKCLCDR